MDVCAEEADHTNLQIDITFTELFSVRDLFYILPIHHFWMKIH